MATELPESADKIEDIPEAQREFYSPGTGGRFYLAVKGLGPDSQHPALKELRDAHGRSKSEREAAKEEARKVKEALEALRTEHEARLKDSAPKANVTALEESYKARIQALTESHSKELASVNGALHNVIVREKAQALAADLAGKPEYKVHFYRAIVDRLAVERAEDGSANLRILDPAGQPSAATIENLKDEFKADPAFADFCRGSKASGGGAAGVSGGGGATGAQKPNFLTSSPAEIDAWMERNKHSPGS